MKDKELLRQFTENGSQEAFAELTESYAGLVYSACMRKLGDHHLAEEASQAVFIVLAKKASTLPAETLLAGWLVKTAYFASMNLLKTEKRRKNREQEVSDMKNTLSDEEKKAWAEITPFLDEALLSLNDTDRNAVVLRFFQNKSNEEIGSELNMKPGTVSQRVSRAMEKLKKIFTKKGVTVSVAVLSAVLAQNAVQAASAGIAASCTAAAAGTGALSHAITSTVQGVITMLVWTKAKIAALAVAISVVITALTGSAAAYKINADREEMQEILNEKDIQIKAQEAKLTELEEAYKLLSEQSDKNLDKISSLEDANWDLKQKMKKAQTQTMAKAETPQTAAEPIQTDPKPKEKENDQGDFLQEYAKMMAKPEMKEMWRQQIKMTLPVFYKNLYKELNLPPEEKEQLDSLITETRIDEMMVSFKLMAEGEMSEEDIQTETDRITEENRDKIKKLLGEDRFEIYTDYEEHLLDHLAISQLESKLATTNYPLQESQKKELFKVLTEEKNSMKDEPESLMNNMNTMNWSKKEMDDHFESQEKLDEKVLLRTSNFLTPDQVKEYRNFLDSQRKMQRTQLEMSQTLLKSRIKQASEESNQ